MSEPQRPISWELFLKYSAKNTLLNLSWELFLNSSASLEKEDQSRLANIKNTTQKKKGKKEKGKKKLMDPDIFIFSISGNLKNYIK